MKADNAYLLWRRRQKLGQREPVDAEEARREMKHLLHFPHRGIEITEIDTEAGFMLLKVGDAIIRSGFPMMPTGDAESCADEVISSSRAHRRAFRGRPGIYLEAL